MRTLIPKQLVFGARRDLMKAREAAGAERVEDAARALRRYFASRYKDRWKRLRERDTGAAMLAAACAAMRGDIEELAGAAELLERSSGRHTSLARDWSDILWAALEGSVDDVQRRLDGQDTRGVEAAISLVRRLADQRAFEHGTPEQRESARRLVAPSRKSDAR